MIWQKYCIEFTLSVEIHHANLLINVKMFLLLVETQMITVLCQQSRVSFVHDGRQHSVKSQPWNDTVAMSNWSKCMIK